MNKTDPQAKRHVPPGRWAFITPAREKPVLYRLLILFTTSLVLSLILFLHRGFINPEFSVGSIAQRDIRADRDFLVMDRAATEQKKAEAARTVEQVFDWDDGIADAQVARLSSAFDSVQKLLPGRDGRESTAGLSAADPESQRKIRADFETALGTPLSDHEFALLNKYRFSADIEMAVSRILHALFKYYVVSRGDLLKAENAKGLIIRNARTQKEEEIKVPQSIAVIENIDPILRKAANAVPEQTKGETKNLALSLSKKLIRPNLTFNKDASEINKKAVLENLKPVFSLVYRNEIIIREGERVTSSDLDKINAYTRNQGGGFFTRLSFFIGIFLTILTFLTILYLPSNRLFKNATGINIDLLFLGLVSVLQLLLVVAGIFVFGAAHQAFPTVPADAFYFAVPFAVGPILAAVFLNRPLGFILSIFSAFLMTFIFEDRSGMFLFSFLGSAAAVYPMGRVNQRSLFYRSGFLAGAVNIVVIFSLRLISRDAFSPDIFLTFLSGLSGGVLSGAIAAGIAPPLESLFGYTTNIKLLELSNLNQPIMQRMILESPGTYHHSIIVASLVESAAEAIGANSLLAKVSAYYHDIGKMTKPLYFIENQQDWKNKHDKLSPKMSSLVIISHVKDGCDLAKQYKLGRSVTNIIRQHHGTGVVHFFYEKALKDKDPSIRSIPESEFRYPGPKPQTKEAGLVLLADVVEASSRALTEPTPSRIRNLVQARIKQVFADGQLDQCELTLQDLNRIADVFERTLNAIFHHRIGYPDHDPGENNGRKETNGRYDIKPPEKVKARS